MSYFLCSVLGANAISAPDGRRDFFSTAKQPQRSHLYTSYEATYVLKCLVLEKIAKKPIYALAYSENRFFRIFSESKHFKAYVAS